jgi:hypothetical protein
MKCSLAQAGQTVDSYWSAHESFLSSSQLWTFCAVTGHLKMKGVVIAEVWQL